jgi:hypothetical protein
MTSSFVIISLPSMVHHEGMVNGFGDHDDDDEEQVINIKNDDTPTYIKYLMK